MCKRGSDGGVYLLEAMDAEFVVSEDQEQPDKGLEAWPQLPTLKYTIAIDRKGLRYYPEPPAAFEDIEARGREFEKEQPGLVDELLDGLSLIQMSEHTRPSQAT